MKRKFTFLIAAMALMIAIIGSGATAWGQTYSTNLSGTWSKDGGNITLNSVNWAYSSATYLAYSSNKLQIGSKNNPQTAAWSIQTPISSFGDNKKITAVTFTGYTTATTATYNISVGGTSVKSGSLTTSSATYTANSLNVTSGSIVISVTGSSSSKAMYISQITVTYETNINTVATPTFSPAAGEYVGTQNVAISTTTADATIYYNFTGEEPWNSYTGPVAVSETSTLYAYATKTDYEDSEIASAAYTISSTITLNAPTLTVTSGNAKVTPTWADVPNASSYTIEYATDSEFTSSETIDNATSGTEITGLTNETTYYFRIKSIGDGVTYMSSDWSATVSATPSSLTTMAIDFESSSSTYTDWTFSNITPQSTHGSVSAHGGSYFGMKISNQSSAYIKTNNLIANPCTLKCYVSRTTTNATASTWYIQTSSNGTDWETISSQSATSMEVGEWVEMTADLTSKHGVYVRVYYTGGTANRTIDDLTLTYAPAEYKSLAVANVNNGTISATIGTTTVTEGNSIDNAMVNATVALTQVNETGYIFDSWNVYKTGDPATTVEVSDNSFTMPDYDVTVSATFVEVQTYAITIDGNITNGSVTSDKATAAQGETVTLTATPNAGYFFGTWNVTYVDGESQTQTITVTNNTFTMPAFPVTVSATFVERPAATFTNGIYTESFASQASFNNWHAYSVSGNETWEYSSYGAYIKGNSHVNEDWLVSPKMSIENGKLAIDFNCVGRYGAEGSIAAYYSVDYPGTGNPNNYTWTEIETTPQIPYAADDWNMVSVSCNISTANANAYFAFKYTSTTESSGTFEMKPFTAKQYFSVTYNNNGGTGEMTDANSPYLVGTEVTTLVNTFTAPVAKPNFVNWNTEADGSGDEYNEEVSFNMPANNVTLYAQWSASVTYTITIDPDIEHGSVVADKATANADETVTLTITPDSHYQLDEVIVIPDGGGDVQITDNQFVMPEDNVTITATFEPILHNVTFSVNGNTGIVTPTSVQEGSAIGSNLPSLTEGIPTGFEFAGWSTSESSITTIDASYVVNAATTLYAVFKEVASSESITIKHTSENFPTSYANVKTYNLEGKNFSLHQVYKNGKMQFKASVGYIYNNDANSGVISSVVIKYNTSDSKKNFVLYAGTTIEPTSNAITPSVNELIYTYDLSSYSYTYFKLINGENAGYLDEITITYKQYNYFTRIFEISSTATEPSVIAATTKVIIKNGGVLTANVTNNGTASNLIIEDGGQLIVSNSVNATAKKHIEKSVIAVKDGESNTTWYSISSPLAASVEFEDVENLIPNDVTDTDYDLYRLDEENGIWQNSRILDNDGETVIANPDFATIDKGVGYIYANTSATTDIAFAGAINVEDVECSLTKGDANGFNLIGNPFMQNIDLTDVETQGTAVLANGFYVLNHNNSWGTKIESGNIAPLQGFLVQATTAGKVTISKPSASKDERSEQNANIEIIVSNSNYSDNAYAMFSDGIGLNKINHRNADAPMVYIPQNGEDFAIAMMDESTVLFPVNFKAMTTGYYTISLKSSQIYEGYNDFDYLHLIDNMTGEEIDMLLEDGYKFVGSPRDNEGRFTVKLHRNGVEENEVEIENFVYQNGNSLVISGEGTFQLIDMLGRVVISKEVHGETVSVDNLITGAYIVRMIGNEVKTQKIVIR